ncbi:MAG: hypothetical protein H5T44_01445 [Thermoplasmatales archaeon]|nr:hypothetical protein [Thermoplasmatales archaeon]
MKNYSYEVIWERNYNEGYGNCRVVVDSKDNIIVCGLDKDYRGLILKYDKDGNLLWNDHTSLKIYFPSQISLKKPFNVDKFLSKGFGSLLDVKVDSKDNIITVGSFYDKSGKYCTIYLKKYSKDGSPLWEKNYAPFLYTQAPALAIDKSDNIFVAGFGGRIVPPSVNGFVMKVSKNDGSVIWNRKCWKMGKYTGYTALSVFENDIFCAGFVAKDDYNLIISNFDKFGIEKNEKIFDLRVLPCKIFYDRDIFICGQFEDAGYKHYLAKISRNFNILWEKAGMEGWLYDLVLMKNGNIAVTGKINKDEYYAGLYGAWGNLLLDAYLGKLISNGNDMNDWMKGTTNDSQDNLVVVGGAPVAKTIKFRIGLLEEKGEKGEKKIKFLEFLKKLFRIK